MDIEKLYQDFNIDYATEGNNFREGWINTRCPFCDDQSYHLGFNTDDNYYHCWKCGFHPVNQTVSELLGVSEAEARKIIKGYSSFHTGSLKQEPNVKIRAKAFKFPSDTGTMHLAHRIYLERRNFNPEYLEKVWDLRGTGPVSKLGELDYRFRIIIPFYWNDKIVSFDSRDITGKHFAKYMACPKEREIIPHKEILYGKQEKFKDKGICVEGPTDVWRLGTSSFAVSGIKFLPEQVRVIAKTFKQVFVMFDGGEPQAKIQANKLVTELTLHGIKAKRIDIEGDPGSLSQSEADYIVKQLIT